MLTTAGREATEEGSEEEDASVSEEATMRFFPSEDSER